MTLQIAVLEEPLAMSRREMEEARPWEGPLGENRHQGTASRA